MTRRALGTLDLDLLYLPFLTKAMDMIAGCEARGAIYRATSGFRGSTEQMRLWKQGRTTPGSIVTHALPGQSAHNFGLALDFARMVDGPMGLKADWSTGAYDILGEEAAKLGLHWGKAYKDLSHVSWPGCVTATDLKPFRSIFQMTPGADLDKLKKVWEAVDQLTPPEP